MKTIAPIIVNLVVLGIAMGSAGAIGTVGWPPPPDSARIVFEEEILCSDLSPSGGVLSKLGRVIAGGPDRSIDRPFDLLVSGERLFMTCQDLNALIEVNLDDLTYRTHRCKQMPMHYPVGVCRVGDAVFVTDSAAGRVYRLMDDRLDPFIVTGLVRPTGIAFSARSGLLYVVDTGDHLLKDFDLDGNLMGNFGGRAEKDAGLNFPTFAVETADGNILINDSLNYRIKMYDHRGVLGLSFGQEGDGPGAFGRAKGIGIDSDGNIYVIDNLFDNVQVFDESGNLLVVIGTTGSGMGQFWSPSGLSISDDRIYIADTYNDRIQVLHYLGDRQ